jgi:hypothetical protein
MQLYDKCLNKLCRKVVYGVYIKWQYTWSVIYIYFLIQCHHMSVLDFVVSILVVAEV